MTELATPYLGLALRSPLVASPSPLTGRLSGLVRLQDCGAAAVVLPSLFEEELLEDTMRTNERLDAGTEEFPEALSYFPETDDRELGPKRHVTLVERAKGRLSIPVIASVNATSPGSWWRYVHDMSEAGADAIELNLYHVPADPARSAADVEERLLDAIRQARAAAVVPLAVKLSPFLSSPAHFTRCAVDAGADGLVLFNRFYQPDLDADTLEVTPRVELSQPAELRLPLRWIAILRGQLADTVSLGATTGIHTGTDAVKVLAAGANVAMMTSALLRSGPEHIAVVEAELVAWLEERGYACVGELRGSACQVSVPDPAAYERAHYIRTLASYRLAGSQEG